jgi:hypothetical protein
MPNKVEYLPAVQLKETMSFRMPESHQMAQKFLMPERHVSLKHGGK